MSEFRSTYYKPIDRDYHEPISQLPAGSKLEDPIIPLNRLGETVPETDPTSGRNIIQTTQAAIRGGAGTLQLVMTTSHDSAIGGRFKAMGKEVREALKEIRLANNINMAGVELPTSLKNLSGFDYQQGRFSEDQRKRGLEEVKDAIKFVADVSGGGGIDIVSWEYPRAVKSAAWNQDKPLFERDSDQEQKAFLVDDRSGKTIEIPTDEEFHIPYDPAQQFKKIDTVKKLTWADFQAWANLNKEENKKNPENKIDRPETPEEIYVKVKLKEQGDQLLGSASQQKRNAEIEENELNMLRENLPNITDPTEKQKIENRIKEKEQNITRYKESASASEQQAQDLDAKRKHYKSIEKYGLNLSADTYAQAGITALREYQLLLQRKDTIPKKPLYVGPEIGWPDFYGSHPEEFIKLVQESRKRMVDLLTKQKVVNERGEDVKNDYYDPRVNNTEAEKLAQTHIKGLFDTSHMGMWLAHFKPIKSEKTGTLENEEERLQRFNKWFTANVKKLAEHPENIVGGIQLVDSASAAHGHLPPGQGIFPVIESAKIFDKAGYKGFFVSEGHEEEKFGQGRIRTQLWKSAGATIGDSYYGSAIPLKWRQVEQNYFGKAYSPLFMFGSYSPSNEFKLWSEVPFE